MPLYEYRCAEGHRFEKIQSFNAPEQLECPKCGQMGERLLSAPAIQFKGSGFYLTDYGKTGGSKSGTSEGGGTAGSDAKASSDSKGSADGGKNSTPAAAPASSPTAGSSTSGGSSSTGSTSSSSGS